MIQTLASPILAATVLHRVAGVIARAEAEQGATDALRLVLRLSREHGPVNLLLDLREMQFVDLQAHRVWSQGFTRNPALHGHVRAVAIVGDDTPVFRAEQALLQTEQLAFFVDEPAAVSWLARLRGQEGRQPC